MAPYFLVPPSFALLHHVCHFEVLLKRSSILLFNFFINVHILIGNLKLWNFHYDILCYFNWRCLSQLIRSQCFCWLSTLTSFGYLYSPSWNFELTPYSIHKNRFLWFQFQYIRDIPYQLAFNNHIHHRLDSLKSSRADMSFLISERNGQVRQRWISLINIK